MQVYRRLRGEQGYIGGYDQVRRYVGKKRRQKRQTFIPLSHEPGQRLEADLVDRVERRLGQSQDERTGT